MNGRQRYCITPILAALAIGTSAGEASAQGDRLEGVYASDAVRMVVVAADQGQYVGVFELEGAQVPFRAQSVTLSLGLEGRTLTPGSETDFEAVMMGGLMVVGDGTQTFFLQRESESVGTELAARVIAASEVRPEQQPAPPESQPVSTSPQTDQPEDGASSAAVSEWTDKVWNARLTYMYSYYSGGAGGASVGASEETTIDVCGRGFFRYGTSGFFSADGGGGAGGYNASSDQGSGTWDVVGQGSDAVLRLSFHDGAIHEYVLSTDEDGRGTYLNGQRFYRTYAHSPIEEYRPTCPA